MKPTVFIAAAALALSACAHQSESYSSRSMRLSMGMDKNQVTEVMGVPRKSSAKMTEQGLSERFFWWSPTLIGFSNVDNEMLSNDRVFVRFVNGKLVEWGDKYDYSAMLDSITDAQRDALKASKQATSASSAQP
ncbi:hypothetical protein OU995_11770 [Roseateles sp. SL47]|uniref:hypothetical protein n=1 Tax=Roseateles sp. SL47 TaxID=2995138 RepID=UPI0022712CF9|nr:hypothetical protein [Roseateles sp. SL47]WAC75326.1 hypothetical protein OU995_11770 [Roseateles sp. SL47]